MKLKTESGPAPTTYLPALPVHSISDNEGQMHCLLPQDAPGDSMKDHVGKIVLLRPSDSLPHLSYTSGVSSPYRSPSPWVNSFLSARLDWSWAEKP